MQLHRKLRRIVRDVVAGVALSGAAAAPLVAPGCACPPGEEQLISRDLTAQDYERLLALTDQEGLLPYEICRAECGSAIKAHQEDTPALGLTQCDLVRSASGDGKLLCEFVYRCDGAGRRPPGLSPPAAVAAGPLGGWLAHAAHLEAAAVVAFELLARELDALDAPSWLLAEVRRAATDEIRHAELMAALARRHGAEPPLVEVAPAARATVEALALDNAVEGCVHETWAALEMTWLAERAPDPALRAAAVEIAADEARHAELSWRLDAWLLEHLRPAARLRVDLARTAAWNALAARVPAPELVARVGLPNAEQAAALRTGLVTALAA